MNLRPQLFLFWFMIDIGREKCSNLWKIIIFLVFLNDFVLLRKFLGKLIIDQY